MKRLFKQIIACVVVISMLAAMGITAFAHKEMDNMVFAGYNTVDPQNPYKVFNEVINGEYTNRQVMVPVEPTWSAEGYEAVYPYAGYSRMYLEGNAQDIIAYNNLFPQWETRRQDWMWQLDAPYYIWERQQTKVNNETWTWDFGNEAFNIPDSVLLTKTAKPAYVIDQGYEYYGFGLANEDYKPLTEEQQYMYKNFLVSVDPITDSVESDPLIFGNPETVYSYVARKSALAHQVLSNVAALSEVDENGLHVITDEMIQEIIPVVYSKYVEAKFYEDSDKGYAKKVVADEYMKYMKDGWEWDEYDGLAVAHDANIYWTDPAYTHEMEYPYNMYQYLVVNHFVFDGRDEDGDGKADRACYVRYTDGKVQPEIDWKLEFFQKATDEYGNEIPYLLEAVERKYVDGVAAVDGAGQPVYRFPARFYDGNCYFKANGNTLEFWGVDNDGEGERILAIVENWTGAISSEINAFFSGSLKYVGETEPQQTHEFYYFDTVEVVE